MNVGLILHERSELVSIFYILSHVDAAEVVEVHVLKVGHVGVGVLLIIVVVPVVFSYIFCL